VAFASPPLDIETPEVAAPSEPLASPAALEVPQFLSATPSAPGFGPAVVVDESPTLDAPTPPAPPAVAPSLGALPPVDPSPEAEPEGSAADRGLALVKAAQFGEAVTLAQEALEAAKSADVPASTTSAALETARLWGVVGLGKAGLDDLEGARFALDEAIALAPGSERLTWERHLADLALAIGRRSLADVAAESPPERVAALRVAIDWLERGLDVAPRHAIVTPRSLSGSSSNRLGSLTRTSSLPRIAAL